MAAGYLCNTVVAGCHLLYRLSFGILFLYERCSVVSSYVFCEGPNPSELEGNATVIQDHYGHFQPVLSIAGVQAITVEYCTPVIRLNVVPYLATGRSSYDAATSR